MFIKSLKCFRNSKINTLGALVAASVYLGAIGASMAGTGNLGGNCSLDSLNFVSVTIGNIAKAPDITIPVNMTCTFNPNSYNTYITKSVKPRRIGFCWHVHNLPQNFPYRVVGLKSTTAQPYINYNFYAQNGGWRVGGKGQRSDNQYNIIGWATGANYVYHMADAMIMRFKNEGNENAKLTPGTYSFTTLKPGGFHGGMTGVVADITPNFDNPGPFCTPQDDPYGNNDLTIHPQVTVMPQVTVRVLTYCQFNTTLFQHIDWGIQASLKGLKPQTGNINVDCSAGTHYKVTVGKGLYDEGTQRYMKVTKDGPGIAYNLSETSWEDLGNGTPAGINRAITATIVPGQATPPDGNYKDVVVLTLEHIAESGDIPVSD